MRASRSAGALLALALAFSGCEAILGIKDRKVSESPMLGIDASQTSDATLASDVAGDSPGTGGAATGDGAGAGGATTTDARIDVPIGGGGGGGGAGGSTKLGDASLTGGSSGGGGTPATGGTPGTGGTSGTGGMDAGGLGVGGSGGFGGDDGGLTTIGIRLRGNIGVLGSYSRSPDATTRLRWGGFEMPNKTCNATACVIGGIAP